MVQSRRARIAANSSGQTQVAETPAAATHQNTGSFLKRGAAARSAAAQAVEDAKNSGNEPWRFWLAPESVPDPKTATRDNPQGIPKNECEIIILDDTLESIVGMHEHNLKIAGKYGHHEGCPKEWDNCVLCDSGEKSYYAVFFSILALRPWVSKDGKKSGGWTKMLLCVKSAQMGKFEELCQAAQTANGGRLRGTYFYMKRDVGNSNAPSIGEPCVLEGGVMFDRYTEENLVNEFGSPAEKSPQGKVLKPANDDITPYNYEEIFKKPDGASLRKRYGGGATQAGSKADAAKEWGGAAAGQEKPAERTAPNRRRPSPAGAGQTPVESGDADPFTTEKG